MERNLLEYLFSKEILVNDTSDEKAFAALFTLANKFNVRITKGEQYASESLIRFVAEMFGERVPEPFYRGFPETARAISTDLALLDQLIHYFQTYGLGDFSEAGHSIFEETFERIAFRENAAIRKFVILTEAEATEALKGFVEDMMKGSRPLSDVQYGVVKTFIEKYNYEIGNCACKDTAIKLLADTADAKYARFLFLSDVIKLVDYINYESYYNTNIKKLNFKNKDRKLITNVIHTVFDKCYLNYRECYEKKAVWSGLLHHIHFKALSPEEEKFLSMMRGKGNDSVYSEFERYMLDHDVKAASKCLIEKKGTGAFLRHLNYIISRCKTEEEIGFVLDAISTENAIILIQLMMRYADYKPADQARTFIFSKYNRMRLHFETDEEKARRKSDISAEIAEKLYLLMKEKLTKLIAGKAGKVYISPEMYKIAVPIGENTSNGGYGVLPKGSRIRIGEDKKVRAFTYWEKVNDIDLSVFGLTEEGEQKEFSWRTMNASDLQSEAITFSGDQTSGFNGGSEYFDIDLQRFVELYPQIKYLIFCDNVFSGKNFCNCLCKAGYMLRDKIDSGEVFEPKTVKSSFTIDCASTYAYLFGIDLEKSDFVWLNSARDGNTIVAGTTVMDFLSKFFKVTSILNVGALFEMMATEIVKDPLEADIVVSDEELPVKEGAEVIRSYNFEKITAILERKA